MEKYLLCSSSPIVVTRRREGKNADEKREGSLKEGILLQKQQPDEYVARERTVRE